MKYPTIAVIFNAPPRAGKDTLAALLPAYLSGPVRADFFKRVLFETTDARTLHDFRDALEEGFWGSDAYDALKDDPLYELMLDDGFVGTCRECLIHVSEAVVKPAYGKDYFGRQLAKDLLPGYNLISDGGFDEELESVRQAADYTMVIRLYREGYTFAKDSRDYIDDAMHPGVAFCDFTIEDETPGESAQRLGTLFTKWELVNIPTVMKAVPSVASLTFGALV